MKTRGRDSASSLEVIPFRKQLDRVDRPPPPFDLTEAQAAEWRAIVNRMPADWFPREMHAILADYCRHVVISRNIAMLIQKMESSRMFEAKSFDIKRYSSLLGLAQRESRALATLATKMRLTQQSTYDKSKKKSFTVEKPWEQNSR